MFLEQVKIIVHQCFQRNVNILLKKITQYIIDDVEIYSDSDIESSDEENLFEKIQMEKNSDYRENSDEEILGKIQMEKDFDEEN